MSQFKNKLFFQAKSSYVILACITILFGCQKFEPERIIKIQTGTITDLTELSCTVQGAIIDAGEDGIIQYGHCWNTSGGPTVSYLKTELGSKSSPGSFNSILTGLSLNTLYYVRAYAANSFGTTYGDEIEFWTIWDNLTISDIDGNVYQMVQIGNQIWMKENLKTTKYNDGTAIPLITDPDAWWNLTTPGYCWYNNDKATYKATYGALYNWHVVNTGKLCPTGWHVPSDAEWTTLITYLGGEDVAGGKLKEAGTTHWDSPNTGATNESGFTALPGGYTYLDTNLGGTFVCIGGSGGGSGIWWSSTESLTVSAYALGINSEYSDVYLGGDSKENGFSVRCLRD